MIHSLVFIAELALLAGMTTISGVVASAHWKYYRLQEQVVSDCIRR